MDIFLGGWVTIFLAKKLLKTKYGSEGSSWPVLGEQPINI